MSSKVPITSTRTLCVFHAGDPFRDKVKRPNEPLSMQPLELKLTRNRKRAGRPHLHLSSVPQSPITSSPLAPPSLHPLNTRLKGSSSSDERHGKSTSASSFFDGEQWRRIRKRSTLKDTVWWGWALLSATWIVFILGMGGVCGVWEWSLGPIRLASGNGFVKSLYFDLGGLIEVGC
jgi:hypothetical protein